MPKTLDFNEEFSINFYGWHIKEKFKQFKHEEGMFIFSILGSDKTFHSSKFKGDDIEKKLEYLEDDEVANWGSIEYYSFDIESTI